MLLKIDRKCFDTRDEAFNFAAKFGDGTLPKSLISIVRSIGHDTVLYGLMLICATYTGLARTMTCLCARRIDVQRVASYARGRAELARKSLAVDVASNLTYGDSRHGREYSENCLNERFSGRALFFETCHSYSLSERRASYENLFRAPFSLSLFSHSSMRPLRVVTGSDKQHRGVFR